MSSLLSDGCPCVSSDDASRLRPLARGPVVRNPRPPAPTPCARTIAVRSAAADAPRPSAVGLVVTGLGSVAHGARVRQTGNGRRVASARLPSLLAWKSRHKIGRPSVPEEIRALIRTMSTANPLWGAPRIHGELLKLGFTISQTTVATYMVRHRPCPSQTWRTFLTNHAQQLIAADFFVVPTATGRLLFVLVLLAHDRRRIVHTAVTAHPTAAWTAQQFRTRFRGVNCLVISCAIGTMHSIT
jgi:hypothetical protein